MLVVEHTGNAGIKGHSLGLFDQGRKINRQSLTSPIELGSHFVVFQDKALWANSSLSAGDGMITSM